MDQTFGQQVREERERRGWSQQKLAEEANTTQQSVDRIERDAVERSRSAPEIAAVLGIQLPQIERVLRNPKIRAMIESGQVDDMTIERKADGSVYTSFNQKRHQPEVVPGQQIVGAVDLPIYTAVRAGSIDDSVLVSPEPIDYVKRPEPLARAKNGYGLYIVGTSMEPVFRQGDLALVHPNMPPKAGDEVVVCSVDVNGEHYAVIKLLTKVTADKWHLKQYNPGHDEPEEFTLDRKEWPVCHLVVGNYRRR